MPVLPNNKHELFAQGLAKGLSADAAYQAAGYKRDRGNAARKSNGLNEQHESADFRPRLWVPQPGPQTDAITAKCVPELFNGGSCGRG
jgi:hypothetical protein